MAISPTAYSTSQDRWLALQQRDPSANSSFFYGVHSTRIYCRPTCPGRLARRSNIIFFDSLDHAHRAGYRPCKRCQPCNDAWDRGTQSRMTVARAKDIIMVAAMALQPWTVEGVAAELGISGGHLHRLFKKQLNTTPKAFAETAIDSARIAQRLSASDLASTAFLPSKAHTGYMYMDVDSNSLEQPQWWWENPVFGDENSPLDVEDLAGASCTWSADMQPQMWWL